MTVLTIAGGVLLAVVALYVVYIILSFALLPWFVNASNGMGYIFNALNLMGFKRLAVSYQILTCRDSKEKEYLKKSKQYLYDE